MTAPLSESLKAFFLQTFAEHPFSTCHLFLAASDGTSQARVSHANAVDPAQAWDEAWKFVQIQPHILRADWVVAEESLTWEAWCSWLAGTPLGLCRYGLSFDTSYHMALTEQELNANGLVGVFDADVFAPRVGFQWERAQAYAKNRFGQALPELAADDVVLRFRTIGVCMEEGDAPKSMLRGGFATGLRDIASDDLLATVDTMLTQGSQVLAHCIDEGGFADGEEVSSISQLGALYALCQAGKESLCQRILDSSLRTRILPNGTEAAYCKEVAQEKIPLAANAMALLALCHASDASLPTICALAEGIVSMQEANGRFIHCLDARSFHVHKQFVHTSYDGMAVAALLCAYQASQNTSYREAAKKAFAYFIATEAWKYEDPWISYACAELSRINPSPEYFAFGVRSCSGRLQHVVADPVGEPLRLMQGAAIWNVIARVERMGGFRLPPINYTLFLEALRSTATKLFASFCWPETAMFFPHPKERLGRFLARERGLISSIDTMQESLLGLLSYRSILPALRASEKKQAGRVSSRAGQVSSVFFLLDRVPPHGDGLTLALAATRDLLLRHGIAKPFLLSWDYQPEGYGVQTLYDFFQEIDRSAPTHAPVPSHGVGENALPNTEVECDPESGRITAIKTFANKHLVKQDRFDVLGFLSSTAVFEPPFSHPRTIIYFRPNHTPALIENFVVTKEGAELVRMECLDAQGQCVRVFTKRSDAIAYWLGACMKAHPNALTVLVSPKNASTVLAEAGSRVYLLTESHLDLDTQLACQEDALTAPLKDGYGFLEQGVEAIVTASENQGEDIAKRFGATVWTIPFPAQEGCEAVDYDPHTVCFLGSYSGTGFTMALDVFAKVLQKLPKARFLLSKRESVRIPKALAPSIVFDDSANRYARAACSLCTSTSDGFPFSIGASLSQGCPVVSADCRYGAVEMIRDGIDGYLVPQGDSTLMAQRIVVLCTQRERRDTLSTNARHRPQASDCANRWRQLLSSLR